MSCNSFYTPRKNCNESNILFFSVSTCNACVQSTAICHDSQLICHRLTSYLSFIFNFSGHNFQAFTLLHLVLGTLRQSNTLQMCVEKRNVKAINFAYSSKKCCQSYEKSLDLQNPR